MTFCSERIHGDTDRRVVFKFREIWPTGDRRNVSAVAEMDNRGRNRHGRKEGRAAVPLSRGKLGPRLTQCGLG